MIAFLASIDSIAQHCTAGIKTEIIESQISNIEKSWDRETLVFVVSAKHYLLSIPPLWPIQYELL